MTDPPFFCFKGMTLVYFITFFGGYKVWHFDVFGIQSVYMFEAIMHGEQRTVKPIVCREHTILKALVSFTASIYLFSIPMSLYNVFE